jgi:cell division septum initiation protein DivIVA
MSATKKDWIERVTVLERRLANVHDNNATLSAKLAEAEREIDRLKLVLGDPEGTIAHADAIVARAEAAEARAAELEKALAEMREAATLTGFWRDRAVASEAGLNELKKGLEVRIQTALAATKEPKPLRRKTEGTLNPGSKEARARGCQCSAVENHHGLGVGIRDKDNQLIFDVSGNCELHRDWEPR